MVLKISISFPILKIARLLELRISRLFIHQYKSKNLETMYYPRFEKLKCSYPTDPFIRFFSHQWIVIGFKLTLNDFFFYN